MLGAIIGDLAGSIYEFEQSKKTSSIQINSLISDDSFYSDDTILTIAILDAILHDKNYEYYLKKYANQFQNYKPDVKPYFNTIFSPGFTNWVKGNDNGTSIGNGAMMRISPVGYLFNTENEVIENAKLATISSHNSKEAIDCATTIALIIYYARQQYSKNEIIKKLDLNYSYSRFDTFNSTCYKTIDNCLYALFTSNSFVESISKVVSFGGDTDTNACIVGSMAEALYGIDEDLIEKAKQKIPKEFVKILSKGYSKIKIL